MTEILHFGSLEQVAYAYGSFLKELYEFRRRKFGHTNRRSLTTAQKKQDDQAVKKIRKRYGVAEVEKRLQAKQEGFKALLLKRKKTDDSPSH